MQNVEEFLPTDDQYPSRRVITVYEYPNSNSALFFGNKRGFRLQFTFLFYLMSWLLSIDFIQALQQIL